MTEFYVKEDFWSNILGSDNSKNLYCFFKEKKYINSKDELTIRFFMYYMNYYIDLPNYLEEKRADIFRNIINLNFSEKDLMDRKAAFKKKPYGFKNED